LKFLKAKRPRAHSGGGYSLFFRGGSSHLYSKYIRNDFIRHPLAVFFPMFTILERASSLVAKGAVEKQTGEEDEIEIGERRDKKCGKGPEKSAQELRDVMEVASKSPPSRSEKNALLFFTLMVGVAG
jgi:hypothetical protein